MVIQILRLIEILLQCFDLFLVEKNEINGGICQIFYMLREIVYDVDVYWEN